MKAALTVLACIALNACGNIDQEMAAYKKTHAGDNQTQDQQEVEATKATPAPTAAPLVTKKEDKKADKVASKSVASVLAPTVAQVGSTGTAAIVAPAATPAPLVCSSVRPSFNGDGTVTLQSLPAADPAGCHGSLTGYVLMARGLNNASNPFVIIYDGSGHTGLTKGQVDAAYNTHLDNPWAADKLQEVEEYSDGFYGLPSQ